MILSSQSSSEGRTERKTDGEGSVWSAALAEGCIAGYSRVAAYSLTLLKLRRYTSLEPVFAQNIVPRLRAAPFYTRIIEGYKERFDPKRRSCQAGVEVNCAPLLGFKANYLGTSPLVSCRN